MALIIPRGPIGISTASKYAIVLVKAQESNGGGRALNTGLPAAALNPRTVKVYNNISLAFEPLQIGYNNNTDYRGDPVIAGMTTHGFEAEIANRVDAAYFPYPVYIVSTSMGGSKIQDYLTDPNATGYEPLVRTRLQGALAALAGLGKTPLVYWLYSQGLNDNGVYNGTAQGWVDATVLHFHDLEAIIGHKVPFFVTGFGGIWSQVDASVTLLTSQYSSAMKIAAADLPFGSDGAHWQEPAISTVAGRGLDLAQTKVGFTAAAYQAWVAAHP